MDQLAIESESEKIKKTGIRLFMIYIIKLPTTYFFQVFDARTKA